MRKTVLLLGLIFLISSTFAQEKPSKQPCFRVSSFSSSIGFGGALTANTNSDYYILKDATDNPEWFIDVSDYKNESSAWAYGGMAFSGYGGYGYTGGGSGNGNLLFNLGLTPYSKKLNKYRENRELRLSLGGSFGNRNNFYFSDNIYTPIDTFQSINGNGLVYADSAVTKRSGYSLHFAEINIGASYLFKTDVRRRVHFYAGAGFNYGITLRSQVNINEDIFRSIYYYDEFNKPDEDETSYYFGDDYEAYFSTRTTNLSSPMHFVRLFIPVGLSLNLSKKPESFFSHVDLYTELNPGVEFQVLSSEKTYANPYFGVGFIGFKYKW